MPLSDYDDSGPMGDLIKIGDRYVLDRGNNFKMGLIGSGAMILISLYLILFPGLGVIGSNLLSGLMSVFFGLLFGIGGVLLLLGGQSFRLEIDPQAKMLHIIQGTLLTGARHSAYDFSQVSEIIFEENPNTNGFALFIKLKDANSIRAPWAADEKEARAIAQLVGCTYRQTTGVEKAV